MKLSRVTNNLIQAMSIEYNTMVYELIRRGQNVLVMIFGEIFLKFN